MLLLHHSPGYSSSGNSNLQTGQVLFFSSHGVRQSGWYTWPQGINMPLLSTLMFSQHTVQVGGSSFWPFFLQCFFSILTRGRRCTASYFAFLIFWRAWASCSEIRRTISNRSSDWNDWLKLFMKSFGLNWPYCARILKNSWPVKISMKERSKLLTNPSTC